MTCDFEIPTRQKPHLSRSKEGPKSGPHREAGRQGPHNAHAEQGNGGRADQESDKTPVFFTRGGRHPSDLHSTSTSSRAPGLMLEAGETRGTGERRPGRPETHRNAQKHTAADRTGRLRSAQKRLRGAEPPTPRNAQKRTETHGNTQKHPEADRAGRQTDRQADRQTGGEADRQRERERQGERQRDRKAGRQRQTERQASKQRETDRQGRQGGKGP